MKQKQEKYPEGYNSEWRLRSAQALVPEVEMALLDLYVGAYWPTRNKRENGSTKRKEKGG